MEKDWLAHAEEVLRISGKRMTSQRRLILRILAESEEHLDAYEVYTRAHEQDPRISLATVYRTLGLFVDMKLVARRDIDTESSREYYECLTGAQHYHFTCLKCGKVIEFKSPLVERAAKQFAQEHDADMHFIQLRLEGLCSECREENA